MLPIIALLAERGLSLLGNAILAKGKEKVEEIIGTKIPESQEGFTPEVTAELRKLEMLHEEKLLEFEVKKQELSLEGEKVVTEAVTKRWEADMLSDSWLSKNIRPISLLGTLIGVALFAIISTFGIFVAEAYVSLFAELLKIMVGAYFVGRTVEKSVDVYQGWKQTKGE